MKFSVLVPVYNVEQYLGACVESLLGQTHSDLEMILVDDGSADASGVICDEYRSRFPDKVRVLHQKNQGQLMARENGMALATGDVLLFVDSDDCLRRDALALLDAAFSRTGCDLIIFNASAEADYGTAYRHYSFKDGQIFQGDAKKQLYERLVSTSDLNNLCLKAVRRTVAVGRPSLGEFSFVKNGEDLLVSMQLVSDAERILFLNQNLYFYRQHAGSVVHSYNPRRAESIRAVHQRMEQYIEQWGCPELKAPHFSREVRGWIETLVLLHSNRRGMSGAEYREERRRMAEERYFRNAYENMDTAALDRFTGICAALLYKKRFGLLSMLLWGRSVIKGRP